MSDKETRANHEYSRKLFQPNKAHYIRLYFYNPSTGELGHTAAIQATDCLSAIEIAKNEIFYQEAGEKPEHFIGPLQGCEVIAALRSKYGTPREFWYRPGVELLSEELIFYTPDTDSQFAATEEQQEVQMSDGTQEAWRSIDYPRELHINWTDKQEVTDVITLKWSKPGRITTSPTRRRRGVHRSMRT